MSVANLLTGYDPSFETTGVNNWLAGSFTQIAQSSVQAHTGSKSMSVVSVSGGTSTAIFNVLIPIIPGAIINPSVWVWAANAAQSAQFNLVWYFSDEVTIVGNTVSAVTPLTAGGFVQATSFGIQAPSNAFWVQLQVTIYGNIGSAASYLDDVALSWGNYATNMCPNPSFEAGLTGWAPARGDETVTQIDSINFTGQQFADNLSNDFTHTLFGSNSMQVITPGLQQNEGVTGPSTWMPVTTTGSMSCNISGQTGTIALQAVDQITGFIIGTQVLTLSGHNWVQAQLSNLTFVSGHTYYLQIITIGEVQDLLFVVDGVMYQPEPLVPIYVDGDQYQCQWSGTAEASASFQPYQFGIQATCFFSVSGIANVINPGETFPVLKTPVLEFFITGGPPPPIGVPLTIVSPSAAMTDFGIWQGGTLGTDLDPAMAYSTWNNEGVLTGSNAYVRSYMAVAPSLDLFNSTGGYTWKRSAYMALGWQFVNVSQGGSQVLADVQTELVPINGANSVTPRNYQAARQLQTIVRPDRLNYLTNPSFESGTSNWSQVGTGQTLALSSNVPVVPDLPFSIGNFSMSVTVTSGTGTGVQITIPFLIPGRTYMCSMWIQPDGGNMGDCTALCGTGSGTLTSSQGTGYGTLPFSSGPYGGIPIPSNPLPATWQQLFFSFEATSDSHVLQVSPFNVASVSYPYTWYIDAVLIEDGDVLNTYFDGNFGVDALWLDGGVANLCQSFYYNQLEFARHIIVDALANNTPLGISYAQPLYATMPTQ